MHREPGIMTRQTQRIFLIVALFLAMLLPLEAAYAVTGCRTMIVASEGNFDCGKCGDDDQKYCQTYCLAFCQALPAGRIFDTVETYFSSITYQTFFVVLLPMSGFRPEPPPPRNLH